MAIPKNRIYYQNKIDGLNKEIGLEEQNIKLARENIAYKETTKKNYEEALKRYEKRILRQGNKDKNLSKIRK